MGPLKIVRIGHPVLRRPAQAVDLARLEEKAFQKFLKDMVHTMHAAEGVGLAANQVGESLQVIVLESGSSARYPKEGPIPLQIYVNPKILKLSGQTEEDWEGCLSIPGYRGLVPRAGSVTFRAVTPEGEKVRKTVSGFQARIIQHEADHLQGFFYVDRMPDLKAWVHWEEFNRRFGTKIQERP